MLKSYKFDIISLRETWLTKNQHQLDYVNIASYESIFKHHKDKKGGGVGFSIKDNISFKKHNDLTKNIVNMEVMLIELHGRNKNTENFEIMKHYFCSDKQVGWCYHYNR